MPNKANTRRDPQKGKKGFSTNKGFTLVELMIAIAVLAIIMSLALPSYQSILEKRRVTSSAEQFAAFLSAAQMEAVKRNWRVAIECDASSCTSTVLDDTNDGDDIVIRTLSFSDLPAGNITVAGEGVEDDGKVIFDPVRGMLAQEDVGPNPMEIKLVSPEQMYALNVQLAATGRLKICSDIEAKKNVPGYDICIVQGDGS